MILILIFALIQIDNDVSRTILTRASDAVEEGARVRATAIDIPLKEQTGLIEVLRSEVGYVADPTFVNEERAKILSRGQEEYPDNKKVLATSTAEYIDAVVDADEAAKKAIIDYITNSTNVNLSGDQMVDIKPENICIKIKELKQVASYEEDISCNVTVNGTSVTVKKEDVKLKGSESSVNKKGEVKVANVVFVGLAFEYKTFANDTLQSIFNGEDESNWEGPGIVTYAKIAYPQID